MSEHSVLKVVHIAPHRQDRGGAELYLRSLIAALDGRVDQRRLSAADLSRAQERAALLRDAPQAVLHLHNVMDPELLSWAAQQGALCTVQDHRSFCPGPGKWIPGRGPCRQEMSEAQCRACLDDEAYLQRMLRLTRARLAALKKMAAVTVLSRYMERELIAAGLDGRRVRVIPPVIYDLAPKANAARPRAVIFVGRLVRAKGVDDAIAAWQKSGVTLPLRFVGTGPLRQEIEAQGFAVTGWQSRAELSAHYASAAAVLLPSRWAEPFGIVGVEALAFGVPVIAWRSGGVEDWHPGGAELVEWGDVDGLATALRAAIGRPAITPTDGLDRLPALAAAHLRLYAGLRRST